MILLNTSPDPPFVVPADGSAVHADSLGTVHKPRATLEFIDHGMSGLRSGRVRRGTFQSVTLSAVIDDGLPIASGPTDLPHILRRAQAPRLKKIGPERCRRIT